MDLGVSGKKLEGRQKIKSVKSLSTTTRTSNSSYLNKKKTIQKPKPKVKTGVIKKESEKAEETIKKFKTKHEEMNELLLKDMDPTISGTVKIRFNHYNKSFNVKNGILKWKDIDDEYAISFVYHGKYIREIFYYSSNLLEEKTYDNRVYCERDEQSEYFYVTPDMPEGKGKEESDINNNINNKEYQLFLEEDSEAGVGIEGLTNRHGSGKLELTTTTTITSGNKQTELLTNQLKQMDVSNLSSEEAKDMIERRDLEDILYS